MASKNKWRMGPHYSTIKYQLCSYRMTSEIVKSSEYAIEDMVNNIDQFMCTLQTKNDLDTHVKPMDEALAKIQEVSTGLTVHLEEYKLSESTPHAPTISTGRTKFYTCTNKTSGGRRRRLWELVNKHPGGCTISLLRSSQRKWKRK
jgi:hypothetical protein